jgi:hypothetical protein
MFKKFYYDDVGKDYTNIDLSEYDNCFVKIFVQNKNDDDMYNNLLEKFYNTINVHELQIVDTPSDLTTSVREDILDHGEDTLTFLGNYIDQIQTDVNKDKLKKFAKELYTEASE